MLFWIVVTGIIGLILLIAEALIPGFGVFGIVGGIVTLGSMIMAGMKYGLEVFLMMVVAFAILVAACVRIMKTKKVRDKFILKDVLNTKDFDESVLQGIEGKKGITITTIQPYGKIEINGKQIDVRSEGGYIEKNKSVEVVNVKGKVVVVKEIAL